MAVNRKDLKEFSRETAIKNEDKALKAGECDGDEIASALLHRFIKYHLKCPVIPGVKRPHETVMVDWTLIISHLSWYSFVLKKCSLVHGQMLLSIYF